MGRSALVALIAILTILVVFNGFFIMAGSNADSKQIPVLRVVSSTSYSLDLDEDDKDVPVTGRPLERASRVALDYIGEGRVTDSEVGDEEGYYEIEITLDDGNQVDVHLDRDFRVLSTEYEDEDDD